MPTIETLFLLVLSILAMESADSVRSLYRHFLPGITKKSMNAFYYVCYYAKAYYSGFMNTTAGMALKLIPEKLQSQPVFLCIDDTMISKLLCVPVWNKGRIRYLCVPPGYRMWQKKESKLELAASMVPRLCRNCAQRRTLSSSVTAGM